MSGRLSGTLTVQQGPIAQDFRPATLIFDDGAGITITTGDSGKMCRGVGARFIMAISLLCMAAFIRQRMRQTLERIPGFLAAIGPDGPVGYATNVAIEETNDPATGSSAHHQGNRPQFVAGV